MAGYNRIIIMGNLTRDPDHKMLTSGQGVCRLSLATNRQFRNKQSGTMVQEVCYIDVDVWGPQADSCRQYLQKGRAVLVEGRLKYDSWEDAEGKTRSKHVVVADRVVFVSSGQGAADSANSEADVEVTGARRDEEVEAPIDAALAAQLKEVKARSAAKAKAKAAAAPAPQVTVSESGDFADEPPFKDDLPF